MTRALITHSFISGELDRAFYARTDLQKYGPGVALAKNFTIDYRGGLKSRPGFIRKAALDEECRVFVFSRGEGLHPILCLFGVGTLELWDGTTFIDHSLTTPYTADCLDQLQGHFWLNKLTITCANLPPYELTFEDAEFDFQPAATTVSQIFPTSLALTTYKITGEGELRDSASATGKANIVFAVTSVFEDDTESLAGAPVLFADKFNYASEAGFGELTWGAVAGAKEYKVYRSIITEGALNIATGLGLVATSKTTKFTDNNFIADFSQPPRVYFDPFANGAVLELDITTAGSGYTTTSPAVVVTTTAGTGLLALPVIQDGALLSMIILRAGEGYEEGDTITVTNPDGVAGVATVTTVSPASGNNPATSTIVQSRRIFAGTPNLPLSFFVSRSGNSKDFSSRVPPAPDDGFSFAIDSEDISPIKHVVRARNSVLFMHARGIDRLVAGEGKAISATSREVENQAAIGVSDAVPVSINDDVIFATRWGSSVFSMSYTFYTNSYAPQDVSVLAPHLIGEGKAPKRFAWVAEPDKLLWVLREDGVLLSLTYEKGQEIYAWAQHKTDGFIADIVAVNGVDRQLLYAVVQREWGWQLEVLANRQVEKLEDYVGVDSAIVLSYETAVMNVSGLTIFNNQTVSILSDGDAILNTVVENGNITLQQPAKKITIGLPFDCTAQTLPLSNAEIIQEGVRGRLVGLALRVNETRGLAIGADPRAVYEMKDKSYEAWGEQIPLRSDYSYITLAANWTRDSQLLFEQKYPLPAHILGFVVDVEPEK